MTEAVNGGSPTRVTIRADPEWEDAYQSGGRTPPEAFEEHFAEEIDEVVEAVENGESVVSVSGRVSDYKTFFGAIVGKRLAGLGFNVLVLSPQRGNRETVVDRLDFFDAEYLELPSRSDLCVWEPWEESGLRVDETICKSNGCPYYEGGSESRRAKARAAVYDHLRLDLDDDFELGPGVRVDTQALRRMGEEHDICPEQVVREFLKMAETAGAVWTSTYAKAFSSLAASGPSMGVDVVVMDEAHDVAADPDRVERVVFDSEARGDGPPDVAGALRRTFEWLDDSARSDALVAARDLEPYVRTVETWSEESKKYLVPPDEPFGEGGLDRAFPAAKAAEQAVLDEVSSAASRNDWSAASRSQDRLADARVVLRHLNRVKLYRKGDLDYAHTAYLDHDDERRYHAAFRPVGGDREGFGVGDVYDALEESGVPEAVRDRFGPLRTHIDQLWENRGVVSHDGAEKEVIGPVEFLNGALGTDTNVSVSATHNAVSDPWRGPGDRQETRHGLVVMPVRLRAKGCGRDRYSGRDSVTPETPWFRDMVGGAKERSGDDLAAVAINGRDLPKWSSMPVETIETSTGEKDALVVNGVDAVGEKNIERRVDADAVLAGTQAQDPAYTARLLVSWWGLLVPECGSPEEALERSWRLLAQHVVSGTVQAGGRFPWDAPTLLFERPEIVELAGFEHEVATPETSGFAGEFVSAYERAAGRLRRERMVVRAKKTVRSLEDDPSKRPTPPQYERQYAEAYDASAGEARDAFETAEDVGELVLNGGLIRAV